MKKKIYTTLLILLIVAIAALLIYLPDFIGYVDSMKNTLSTTLAIK